MGAYFDRDTVALPGISKYFTVGWEGPGGVPVWTLSPNSASPLCQLILKLT